MPDASAAALNESAKVASAMDNPPDAEPVTPAMTEEAMASPISGLEEILSKPAAKSA